MKIANITIDSLKAVELANWYVELLDGKITENFENEFVFIEAAGLGLGFQQEEEVQPGKNRVHIDFGSEDLVADSQRCIAKGAKHVGDFEVPGMKWVTFEDPEGNVFDICQPTS